MLNKKLESLFGQKKLLEVLEKYKNNPEYQATKESIESGNFQNKLLEGYIPQPLQGFEIPKHDGQMRQLAQTSLASKVIQKIIVEALEPQVELSDRSYAFRQGKGVLKAIGRAKHLLKSYTHIAKADIENFFDTINQDKLIKILEHIITDKRILLIISLFLKNGLLKSNQWIDKTQGVYQGDVLSPLLSNIYLNLFDKALEKGSVEFIRYGDDMLFFAHDENEAKTQLQKATSLLASLDLRFGEAKSYTASLSGGFEFLGLRFQGDSITMDNDRFTQKLSTLSHKTKRKEIGESVDFFNEYIQGLKRYYAKVLTKNDQLLLIKEHIEGILIRKIAFAKKNKTINNKGRFLQILVELEDFFDNSIEQRKIIAENIITKAYDSLSLEKPLESATKVIDKSKSKFLQDQIKNSEIILSSYGLYVSTSKGKVIVKEYGKVVKTMPINWLTRIVVLTSGASLSTALIYACSRHKIDIDFIDRDEPYAQIIYHTTINNELHLKQLEFKNSKDGLNIAKVIIQAKVKNQLNLIKYHTRYRASSNLEEYQVLKEIIVEMENRYKAIKNSKNNSTLMGHEGSISTLYWRAFGIVIQKNEFHRETKDATDSINQALNYGYAFLYGRVQSALLKYGINIYHSFLHSSQANKPTLVYDMIELFRQPTVDREIIALLNRGTPIESSKGRLDPKSIKAITTHIQARLATPTKYNNGKYKMTTIIDEQALELSHTIKGVKKQFRAYSARY